MPRYSYDDLQAIMENFNKELVGEGLALFLTGL